MRYICLLCFIATSVFPVPGFACTADQQEPLRSHLELYPVVGDSTRHWPAEAKLNIDSVISLLVPIDTKTTIKDVQKGMLAPLIVLDAASHEQVRTSRSLIPQWFDIDFDPKKYKWLHILANSYGVSEVHMRSAYGWSHTIKFTLGYPSPIDLMRRPPVNIALMQGKSAAIEVDANDNIEVTVTGTITDGWNASPDTETGFRLIRILQIDNIYSDAQVKLFFAGTRNPKTSTLQIQQGYGDKLRRFELKINALPTPTC